MAEYDGPLSPLRQNKSNVPPLSTQVMNPAAVDVLAYNMLDVNRIPRANYVEQTPPLDQAYKALFEQSVAKGATVVNMPKTAAAKSVSSNTKLWVIAAVVVAAVVFFGTRKKRRAKRA